MSTITTHVLDTALGKPAAGIRVTLHRDASLIGAAETDDDGRAREFLQHGSSLSTGDYVLTFAVADYFARTKRQSFYNEVVIHFAITDETQHYHVPLLLSPFGYSTYRGS